MRDAFVVVRSEAVLQEQQEFFCRYYVFNVKDNSLTEDNKELRFCFKTEENGEKKGLHMNFTEIINGEKIIAENFLIRKPWPFTSFSAEKMTYVTPRKGIAA